MILAAVGDTGYDIVLVLHILAVTVAFAPAFVHPLLANQSKAYGGDASQRLLGSIVGNGRMIYAPALIVAGLLGFALAGMSDDVYSVGDGWMIAAIIVWIAQNGVLHAVVLPGERAWARGDTTVESRVALGGGIITILLVVQVILMVFKPGA